MPDAWVLDLNDVHTRVWRGEELAYSEPALAIVSRKGAVTGTEALGHCRLEPANFHSKFVDKLNQEALTTPSRMIAHQADLLYEFLVAIRRKCEISSKDEVWVAVSSDVTNPQLGLLYGVLQAAGYSVRDFVDRSIAMAAGSGIQRSGTVLHLGLHRTVVTRYRIGAEFVRDSANAFADPGFARFINGWIQVVTNRFLQASRFDPRRFGETEQQVFDLLWSCALGGNELGVVDISYRGETRQAEVSIEDLVHGSHTQFAAMAPHLGDSAVVLAERYIVRLPGMREFLQSQGIDTVELAPESLLAGISSLTAASAESGEARRLHTAIPIADPDACQEHPEWASETQLPTHLLHDAVAIPLSDELSPASIFTDIPSTIDFRVRRNKDAVMLDPGSATGLTVNGLSVGTATGLSNGDVIDSRGHRFRCIAVVDGH